MKIGVLLSGCGVYDGAEIHETVLTLLALEEKGLESICIGIDKEQHHVVNHISGNEMNEKRNMLTEASRIARGNIININNLKIQVYLREKYYPLLLLHFHEINLEL
mgnify:CR=1 FL=1